MTFSGIISRAIIVAAVVLGVASIDAAAQPSMAQVKKDVSGPKTVSVTVLGRGTRVWSKGYSKYVWDVPYTAKVKSEEPGVNILVEATASYDLIGGRYVYWRSFVGSNVYEGITNPTEAEVAALLKKFGPQPIMLGGFYAVIKVEGLKLADKPRFEWHNLNSVSFTIYITVTEQVDYQTTRRVAKPYRARLYRDGKSMPWKGIGPSDNPNDDEVEIVL